MKTLTLVLVSALSVATNVAAKPTGGYLDDGAMNTTGWVPAAPQAAGSVEASDLALYFTSRDEVATARGATAQADDVYDPAPVGERFKAALGFSPGDLPLLLDVIARAQKDLEAFMRPVKIAPPAGRTRPYVRFPAAPACPHTAADTNYHMDKSGSYPSTHAALGWLWAQILTDVVPDHSTELLNRGYDFGESRMICGFHFSSDLVNGRLVASGVHARLQADKAFQDDLATLRLQIKDLKGGKGSSVPLMLKKAPQRKPLPILDEAFWRAD